MPVSRSQRETEGEQLFTGFLHLAMIPPELNFMPLDSNVFLIIFFLRLNIEILLPVIQRT